MILGLITALISCNSNGDGEDNFGDTTGANIPGIQNVNGNMPDTTNSIMIEDTSGMSPKDTAR